MDDQDATPTPPPPGGDGNAADQHKIAPPAKTISRQTIVEESDAELSGLLSSFSAKKAAAIAGGRSSVEEEGEEAIKETTEQQSQAPLSAEARYGPNLDWTSLKPGTELKVIMTGGGFSLRDDQLEFEKGDILVLDDAPADGEWWFGTNRGLGANNGNRGFFSPACVKLHIYEESREDVSQQEQEASEQELKSVPAGTRVRARFSFTASKADELPFGSNDEIVIVEAPSGGWWRGVPALALGSKTSKTGWFPSNYVDVLEVPQRKVPLVVQVAKSESTIKDVDASVVALSKSSDHATSVSTARNDTMSHSADLATSILSLNTKTIFGNVSDESSSPKSKITAASSELHESDESLEIDTLKAQISQSVSEKEGKRKSWVKRLVKNVSGSGSASAPPASASSTMTRSRSMSAPDTQVYVDPRQSMVEQQQQPAQQHSAIQRSSSAVVSAAEIAAKGKKRISSLPTSSVMSLTAKIVSDDAKESWVDSVPEDVLERMTPMEKKRQSAIWELISTEREYIRDLIIIIDAFLRPMVERKLFPSQKQAEFIFSNIDKILPVHQELLKRLEERRYNGKKNGPQLLVTAIGDVFVKMSDFFTVYTPYCKNHSSALLKLQSLTSTNKSFRQYLEDVYRSSITRNLDLPSFLLKPVQRVCKYPLLLREILKYTDEKDADYQQVRAAVEKTEASVARINESTRSADQIKKLLEIQATFTDKINIVAAHRYLVREDAVYAVQGDLKKARRVLLFNDLLVIAKKDWRDKHKIVAQAALADTKVTDIADDTSVDMHLFEIEVRSGAYTTPDRFLVSMSSRQIKHGWIEAYTQLTQATIGTIPLSEAKSNEALNNHGNDSGEEEEEGKSNEGDHQKGIAVLKQQLSDSASEHKEQLTTLRAKLSIAEAALAERDATLGNAQAANAQRVQELEQKLQERTAEIKELKEEKTTLLAAYQKQIADLQVQLDAGIKKFKAEVESKVRMKDGEIDKLRQDVASKEQAIQRLERDKTGMHQALVQELGNVKRTAAQTTENLKNQLHSIQSSAKSSETATTRLELEKQQLQLELAKVKAAEEATRNEYRNILSNLEKTLRERQDSIHRKEAEIQEVTRKYVTSSERGNELALQCEKLKGELDLLHRASSDSSVSLKNEVQHLRTQLDKKQLFAESIQTAHLQLEQAHEAVQKQVRELAESNLFFKAENHKLAEKVKEMDSATGSFSSDKGKLQTAIANLTERLEKKKQECVHFETSERNMRAQFERLREANMKLGHEHSAFSARLQESEKQRIAAEERYATLKDKVLSENSQWLDKMTKEKQTYDDKLQYEMARMQQSFSGEASALRQQHARQLQEIREAHLAERSELKSRFDKELAVAVSRHGHELESCALKYQREIDEVKARCNAQITHDQERSRSEVLELRRAHSEETSTLKARHSQEISDTRSKYDAEVKQLVDKVALMDETLKEKTRTTALLKKHIRSMEAEEETYLERIKQQEEDLGEKGSRVVQLESALASQKDHAAQLMNKIALVEADLTALQNRIGFYNDLDKRYLELKAEFNKTSRSAEKYESEFHTTQDLFQKRQRQMASVTLILNEIAKQVGVSIQDGSSSESATVDHGKLMLVLTKIHDMQLENDRLASEAELERSKVQELEGMAKLHEKELQTTHDAIGKIEQKTRARIATYKEQEANLEARISSLADENETLMRRVSGLEQLRQQLLGKLKESDGKIQALERRVGVVDESKNALRSESKSEVSSARQQLSAAVEEKKLLATKCKDAADALAKSEAQKSKLAGEREDLLSKIEQLADAKQQLQQQLDLAHTHSTQLAVELDHARRMIDKHDAEILDVRQEKEALLVDLSQVRFKVEEQQGFKGAPAAVNSRELAYYQEKLNEIRTEYLKYKQNTEASSKKRVDELMGEITELKGKIVELRSHVDRLNKENGELKQARRDSVFSDERRLVVRRVTECEAAVKSALGRLISAPARTTAEPIVTSPGSPRDALFALEQLVRSDSVHETVRKSLAQVQSELQGIKQLCYGADQGDKPLKKRLDASESEMGDLNRILAILGQVQATQATRNAEIPSKKRIEHLRSWLWESLGGGKVSVKEERKSSLPDVLSTVGVV